MPTANTAKPPTPAGAFATTRAPTDSPSVSELRDQLIETGVVRLPFLNAEEVKAVRNLAQEVMRRKGLEDPKSWHRFAPGIQLEIEKGIPGDPETCLNAFANRLLRLSDWT
eukprot:CAMPEP_0170173476 /NCGR_PEP_ID=MMETSP0040_2-20121228/6776_1 /TAXON_ID=641309 /ORGANISM="Lotharella oceanica, Strain CCMP622" /LENGTH=110 /DNA_ID=CAMNT_0010414689 /DNA_START=61 /DNA_END=394 /DNA_ORIENTATION=+